MTLCGWGDLKIQELYPHPLIPLPLSLSDKSSAFMMRFVDRANECLLIAYKFNLKINCQSVLMYCKMLLSRSKGRIWSQVFQVLLEMLVWHSFFKKKGSAIEPHIYLGMSVISAFKNPVMYKFHEVISVLFPWESNTHYLMTWRMFLKVQEELSL